MKGNAPDRPAAFGAGTLIDSYDFYGALVESSDDAIIAKDADGIVISWNPAAERLFGYSRDEMIGQSIRVLLPPGLSAEEDHILARIRAGDRISQMPTRRLHKDGRVIDVSVTVSPVRDGQGRIVGASAIIRDLGPMQEQQRRLAESEARLRMLADNIAQFAWIADANGDVIWFNQRWLDYTGVSVDRLSAQERQHEVLPDEYREVVRARFRAAVARNEPWEDIFPLRGQHGELRWFLSRAQPFRDEHGDGQWWFGTNTDITEQREQAEQIRLLLLEVNHRSKNLLSTIQALARRSDRNEPGFMERFESRVQSLAVNQDILVRREWREVPLRELVEGQLLFAAGSAGQISLSGPAVALRPRAAEVVGMALHELATNALKYGALSVAGGTVEIGWDRMEGGFWLRWQEGGGPEVTPPVRSGFGTRLIRDVPRHNLAARITLDYPPEGLVWTMECDQAELIEPALA